MFIIDELEGSLSVPDNAYYVRFAYYYVVGSTKYENAFKNFTISMK